MKNFRKTTALLVPALLSLSMVQAAEPVQWNDLPKKIGQGTVRSDGHQDRQYRVVTKDGLVHVGYALTFSPVDVKVSPSEESIPREQVAEIRIHRNVRLSDALKAPAGKVFDSAFQGPARLFLSPFVLPLIPVAIGMTAAAAPIVLPIEGIKRRRPDKVVKVAP